KFIDAAKSVDSLVIPDPWDDDNPLNPLPKPVALPNGVPRPAAFLGPKYEIVNAVALDPGSLVPNVEKDVLNATTFVPRPVRLDDIVYNIERVFWAVPGSTPIYPRRKQASIFTEQIIHLAGILYYAAGHHFTETASWFKQVCAGLPCFFLLGW